MTDREPKAETLGDAPELAAIVVPAEHAERVRAFASSLAEEQAPDIVGYAKLTRQVGERDLGRLKPMLAAVTGTEVVLTVAQDIDSGDSD